MATTLDDPLGIDQRDPLGIEQSDPLGIEADKPLPSTLGLTNARSARGHIPNIETLPGDIRREYEQLPPEARFQLETLGGTLGASSRGAGQMMSYAGNVARAIPADIAALTKGVEAVPEAQGNLLTALKQPLVGDISRADGAPSRALPIDTALEAAREDAKERQAFPWAAIVGEVSQGVAETMPKMAALPLAGEGALAQGLASAGVFGLDNSGNFNPKSAVTMGLLPGVGKAVKGITAAGIGGAIATGATALENPVAQKVLEEIGHQAGLNAYMLAAESPELARLQQENPEEFRRQLVSIVANNLGFGLLGVKNWQGRVPSATERFIERNAEIFTQDVLARQVGRVAGRELGAATEQPLPRQLAEAEATIRSLPPGWRPPAEEISPRETGKADPLGIETGRGARVESPEPAQPPANPVVAKIDNLAAAVADLKAALTQNQIAAKPESSTAQTPESSTEKLLASPTTNPAAEAPAVAGKPVELPAAAQQRRPTTETTPPEVSTTGRGAGQPAPASLPVPKAAQLFDNLVREYGVPRGWTTGDEGFYDATLWQNNPGSSVGAKVQASKQLQAARERAASDFVPAGGDRGVATPEQRATLLPALIAHLKRELPDSANAVDAAQKLAEFGSTRETEPNAAQRAERFRQDRAILERIQSQHSGRSPLLGVSVVGDGTAPLRAGGTEPAAGGNRPRGLAPKVRSELERVFGVRIVQVAHPDGTARFNGAKDVRSNTILLDVNSDISPMAVAGHELWHHVELTDPALARDVRRQLVALMQNEEGFQARLALRGEQADNVTTVRELIGDWFGDNAARPDFWKTLAAKEPNVFRRLATRVKAWLDKILGRAKSYGVESHFSDVAEARRVVEQALAEFARNRIAGENVKRTETPTAEEWDALLAPDKRRDLRDEGVTPENIEALLSGKKTAVQVVEEQLGVKRSGDHIDAETMIVEENGDGSRSIGFTPPAGPASTSPVNIGQMSHVDAIMMARDQGVDRINRILRGDSFSRREEEIKAARGYVPPRFQMDKPIVGPTGAKIVGYEWRSTMGEKWSNAKQEYVEARVSDWDNSDKSTGTGRDIVHVFYVEHPDGRVRPEGIRSAQNVLGINETRLMTIAKRERAAQQYREQQLAADVAAYEKTAKDTPAEAARDFRVRNRSPFRSFEEDNQLFNESVLFEKGGKYVRRLPSATENMVRHGWTVAENDAAIPGRVPPAVAEAEPIRAQEQKARVAAEKSKAESREGGKLGGVGHDVWIPFDDHQVKSASENTGAFDPNKADIRFSRTEGTWQEQQRKIAEAEAELRERIAEQMTPPAGMTKAQAREAKNAAAAKVRNLRADLLQAPDYAEHLITQEAELVRQLNALVKPAGVTVGPDWLLGREEKLRSVLDDTQIQRVLQLDQEWERVRGELELMPKKLLKAVAAKLYPPPKPNAPSNLNVPSEWLTARLGDRDPVQTAEDVTTARERVQEKIKALPDALRTGLHEARRFTQRLQAGARTLGNRDLVAATKDAADNKAHIVSRQAANVVLAELNRSFGQPTSARDPMREAALTFAIEAQDLEGLRLMREQVQGSEFSGGKWAGQAVDAMNYAEKHWDRLQPVADLYSKLTDAQVAAENEAGIKTLHREQGYVFHTHDLTENWAHLDTSGGAGGAATPFKNIRDYATYADSIAAGVSPKSLNAVDLLQRRLSLGQKLINYRTWVQQLRGLLDPATQQPLAADVVNRVRADGTPNETAPMGYQLMRFAGQTYAVHKAYANLFKALTTESNWRMSGGWQALMKTMTTAKHATLLFDTFHLGRIAYWNAITRGAGEGLGMSLLPGNPLQFKRGLLMLDQLPANLEKMVKEGELTREQADTIIEDKKTLAKLLDAGLNVGGVADNIYSDWVQHLPVAGTFNKWLFEKYQRGAMAGVSVIEYRRQRRMHPEMSDEQVARLTARAVNIRFGNLNSQAWIKSKFAQDLFRVVFLAPQWNESLLRSEFEAVKDAGKFAAGVPQGKLRVGTLGRAVATAFIGQFIANQIINFFTRGQPTWENPEEGMEAKISAWVPDVVGNSAGYFLNPLTLPAEMTHLILKGHERTGRWDEAIMGAVNSRLSSLGRFTAVFAAGKNSQGEAATGLASRIGLAAEEAAPLPIGAQAPSRMVASLVTGENKERYPGQFQRQIMQSVGIKPDSAPTPERRITALAQEFNRTRNVPDVERAHSPYSNLDGYLKVGNLTAAREELERLLVTREPEQILKRYELRTKGRFTGAAGRETDFFKTLNGEQRIQYKKATDERKRIQAQVQKLLRDMRVTK